jgi:aspartyl-tRNA(Asn)/glutamyl-tRNA(Gln) amidotransferase subunit B
MEIVTEPDLRSSFEASEYMKKLRQILRYLGTCDGDMEKGSLRCDANVSVRKRGEQKLGTRCEIKNLNSIRNVMRAIDYEAERQIAIINNGGVIDQETRLYDVNKDETRTMRSKEDAFDYRYFPDPDLLTVEIDDTLINRIKASMPELPEQKLQHYITEFKISEYDAEVLLAEQIVTKYFEEVASKSEPKLAANWITVELFAKLNKNDLSINESPVSADNLAKLIKLIMNNIISGKIAKEVFEKMFSEGRDAEEIVESEGLKQIIDENAISAMIEEILHNNSDKVAEYKSGKHKLFGFFVGQVMKASGGKVNPELANQILQQKLNG